MNALHVWVACVWRALPAVSGAVEFLHDALAALCLRVRNAPTEEVRGLNRLWVDSILVLLLPSPSAGGLVGRQQQQHEQADAASASGRPAAERPGSVRCFLEALDLPLSGSAGDAALPPPLRKSKSLGLAVIAILGCKQHEAARHRVELEPGPSVR